MSLFSIYDTIDKWGLYMFRMSLYAHPHVRRSESYFGYAYAYKEINKHLRNYNYNGDILNVDINSPKSKTQLYLDPQMDFFMIINIKFK